MRPYAFAVTDDQARRADLTAFVRPNLDRLAAEQPTPGPRSEQAVSRADWWSYGAIVVSALLAAASAATAWQVWRHAHDRAIPASPYPVALNDVDAAGGPVLRVADVVLLLALLIVCIAWMIDLRHRSSASGRVEAWSRLGPVRVLGVLSLTLIAVNWAGRLHDVNDTRSYVFAMHMAALAAAGRAALALGVIWACVALNRAIRNWSAAPPS